MSNINWELLQKQKIFILALLCIPLFFTEIYKNLKKPVFKKTDLQIDINSATKDELLSVPYIGEKNVQAIISYRKNHHINDISQLKEIRFFEKFKYFLKVEK